MASIHPHRSSPCHACRPRCPLLIMAALAGLASACTTTESVTRSSIIPPATDAPPPAFGSASQTSVSSVGVCTVAYDGFTLPLVSPDGRWLATQVGVAPTWPTLLATKDQTAPMASSIEIWALDAKSGRRVAEFGEGLILGRSAVDSGFLVEEVLDDGSRRIGLVEWPERDRDDKPATTRAPIEPDWILDDGRVNAFASLSMNGRSIAWCVREVRDDGFSLAVRHAGDSAARVGSSTLANDGGWKRAPGPGQSWLFPLFGEDASTTGGGATATLPTLFAMRYRDGMTDLVAGDSGDAVSFEQSEVVRRLSIRMDERRSYQTLAPQGTAAAVGRGEDARLVLFDPDLRRMAIWDPRDDSFRPLASGTFAACLAPDGAVLASDRDGLILDHARAAPGFPPRVYPRAAIPRHVTTAPSATPHDWILFVPDRKMVSVVRFALIDAAVVGK